MSSRFDAPADVTWAAVRAPQTFVFVAKGMLRFPAAERVSGPWAPGMALSGWILLFGVVPLSRHSLTVESVDDHQRTMVTNECGGVIRAWRHELSVRAISDRACQYEDHVDISAGVFTPLVATFSKVFFRYRQRRWNTLLRLLEATSAIRADGHPDQESAGGSAMGSALTSQGEV